MKVGLYHERSERDACGVGLVAQLRGEAERRTVVDALQILVNLEHRGAQGGDSGTGDGAGILVQIPDLFLRNSLEATGNDLPPLGHYAVAMLFLQNKEQVQKTILQLFFESARRYQLELFATRVVPVNSRILGARAKESEPLVLQAFVRRGDLSAIDERDLYFLRRELEEKATRLLAPGVMFHVPSFSSQTLVYKGLLLAPQISEYYLDLQQESFRSRLALVHQRYSTNTFPSWPLAHPFRFLCHNGEINTISGNVNWMDARESAFAATQCPKPIIPRGLSDSGSLDAAVEFLVRGGRSLPEAMAMLIPEAWEKHQSMSNEKRAFYEYHACLMEPWDGPALVAFTDGQTVGAVLDRNGLRPARYVLTKDDRLILASEAGALELPISDIKHKGRLEPGKMLLADLHVGEIIDDERLKKQFATGAPYESWLRKELLHLDALPAGATPIGYDQHGLQSRQRLFGYTSEDLNTIMLPMAKNAEEPVGSMGADIPLAVFSERPVLLFDYFKQLFAQVTNPPLDAIREALVTSTEVYLGSDGNVLAHDPRNVRRLKLDGPLLDDDELAAIRQLNHAGLKAITLSSLFPVAKREDAGASVVFERAIDQLAELAEAAVDNGYSIIVLSDRDAKESHAPIPTLLACSAVHHALIRAGKRARCSIVIETGEAREVHHIATLLGFGASAVNPYLALASLKYLQKRGLFPADLKLETARENFLYALTKGVVKVMSKMGISVLRSYSGAQTFEALGLHESLVSRYFPGVASRIGGLGTEELLEETLQRHRRAFQQGALVNVVDLELGGEFQWRRQGERHLNNPMTVAKLQQAVRQKNFSTFQEYTQLVNEENFNGTTLRGLLEFVPSNQPVPLEEVEPAKEIVKRFRTGAMSFGSISFEAHANLALAMNRIGGKSNSGEGGEDSIRERDFASHEEFVAAIAAVSPWTAEQLEPGDSLRSSIRQVASARFGVTSSYLAFADEIQIKVAQGAKPGEGGQLPGHKVDHWIARVRHSSPGIQLISPPPHHDIYSIEDLAELIYDLKSATPNARISVKLVSEVGVGTIAAGVAKAKADAILISGSDGGTGAAPLSSIKHAGLPWELGLAEAHQVLVRNGLRDRVLLETDGQLKTGRDVAIACLLGAEEFGFSTAPMIAQGCVMMRKCHLNTCPVGVATQDPELREKFRGKPEHVINFMFFVAEEVRAIMARLGFRSVAEMVGRAERLQARRLQGHWKARNVTLEPLLFQAQSGKKFDSTKKIRQQHDVHRSLDARALLGLAAPAIFEERAVYEELRICNTNRAVGARLGCEIIRSVRGRELQAGSIHFKFYGSAGQSFAAFIPPPLKLELEGEANDYLGKGLSGGTVILYPPRASRFEAEEQVIAGNVAFYGATSGRGFIRGRVGERFCVRNSGAELVVEGVGEHACEYMTGGKVLILGSVGRNLGAGMSGGMAFLYDPAQKSVANVNRAMLEIDMPGEDDILWIEEMLEQQVRYTGSALAERLLLEKENFGATFKKVIPQEYKRLIQQSDRRERRMGVR